MRVASALGALLTESLFYCSMYYESRGDRGFAGENISNAQPPRVERGHDALPRVVAVPPQHGPPLLGGRRRFVVHQGRALWTLVRLHILIVRLAAARVRRWRRE